jgi:crotonobetainyl-CoA:carnitine CoA-transferase CaiB-like acyl-CoA transferase
MGAEIIKIEPPKVDFFRNWAIGDRYVNGESISFMSVNRNKRSIVLDLKQEDGIKIAKEIIKESDIVIENFRPGVMDRLGLGFNDLQKANPKIIYCASSGYGTTGPYVDYPGQDLLIQAMTGTMWLNGRLDDPPVAVGFGLALIAAGALIRGAVNSSPMGSGGGGGGSSSGGSSMSDLYGMRDLKQFEVTVSGQIYAQGTELVAVINNETNRLGY